MENFELVDESSQFYKSDDVGVTFYHRPPHSAAIDNSSGLNKACYCSSGCKHQASTVARVNAGGSATSL